MQNTGCLGLVHWDDPEGWYGEGGRSGVQDGEHVYTRARFMLKYGLYSEVSQKEKHQYSIMTHIYGI